jgi:hypothetical protein
MRRWSTVEGVQVFVLRLESPDASGAMRVEWAGDVPLRWKYQEFNPVSRTIGPQGDCDLCNVVKEKWLELQTLIQPFGLQTRHREACRLAVTLQARGHQADSNELRIQIHWDGEWGADTAAMRRHLVIKEDTPPALYG